MYRKTAGIVFTDGRWSCCVGRHRECTKFTRECSPRRQPARARSSARTCRAWSRWSPIASACFIRARSVSPMSRPGARCTPDALFRIASMTKAVTSVALMQLDRAGPPRSRRPGRKIPAGAGGTEGRSNRSTRRPAPIALRPAIEAADGQALPDAHVRIGLSVHQRDLARFQAARRRNLSVRRAAAVRSGRALALQHQHRCRRQAGRGACRARSSRIISASTSLPRSRWMTRPTTCRRQRGRASSRSSSAAASAWTAPSNCRSRSSGSP